MFRQLPITFQEENKGIVGRSDPTLYILFRKVFKISIKYFLLVTALNSQQIQILNASCYALGLIAKRASLPLNNENSPQQDNQSVSKLEIVKRFQEMINSPKTNVKVVFFFSNETFYLSIFFFN